MYYISKYIKDFEDYGIYILVTMLNVQANKVGYVKIGVVKVFPYILFIGVMQVWLHKGIFIRIFGQISIFAYLCNISLEVHKLS